MKGQYDVVFSVVLSVAYALQVVILKMKIRLFCDFHAFFKTRGANVTLFLWKGCQLEKRLGTYV